MSIPDTATHQWCPNDGPMRVGYVIRLGYYRMGADWWEVFSERTGWRKSENTPEWFEEEINGGYFKEIVT